MNPELLDQLEKKVKPSLWRVIYTFPITLLIIVCIPLGFIIGAILSGGMIGFRQFGTFAAKMAVEGMVREMKKRQGK